MKILILGGCGAQGRAALYDLASDDQIKEIFCADINFEALSKIESFTNMEKITKVKVDARSKKDLIKLYKKVDVVIDLLPKEFQNVVYEAALEAKVSVVNTNYIYSHKQLDDRAKKAGITILPECGLDPGIDLVLYGDAKSKFDEIHVIDSYCGGFPDKAACTNPLNYKISWIWKGVLSSTMRDGRIIRDKQIIDVPAISQHDEKFVHMIDFPELGTLEAFPNGDAVYFTDFLGITDTITRTGRYTLRWPGWSAFWRPMKQLGFLSENPVKNIDYDLSPFDFLDKFLGPQLEYGDNEKDLVAMINIFEGIKDKKRIQYSTSLLIERDLDTGIMAMSKGVGYTASIVAKMIVRGDIPEKGVLSPIKHIPAKEFFNSLKKRGIKIKSEIKVLEL